MLELSIVIPAYNESGKIERDILSAEGFLTSESISGQVIVVDDGSSDDTATVAKEVIKSIQPAGDVVRLEKNKGKGAAIRAGIGKSQGDFVVFTDSGCCIPYEEIKLGLDLINSGKCQIAHGSRKMSDTHIHRPQSTYRKICSKMFHWFLIHDIKRLGNLTDTQCGFKVYQGPIARDLYAKSEIDGFMFDIEIILLALSAGHTICEFPVDWTCDPDSRLKPVRELMRVFSDLIQLKKRFGPSLKQ
ncbi:MAG: glycosyltransferase [Planctomycetota bacterium]|jgi:glycosyltransferase involved in cell wall biosynthesis